MRIIDMTLYRNRNLKSLEEVDDFGRFVVVFETSQEYLESLKWIHSKIENPGWTLKEMVSERQVNWEDGGIFLMIYHGAIEYANYETIIEAPASNPRASFPREGAFHGPSSFAPIERLEGGMKLQAKPEARLESTRS